MAWFFQDTLIIFGEIIAVSQGPHQNLTRTTRTNGGMRNRPLFCHIVRFKRHLFARI